MPVAALPDDVKVDDALVPARIREDVPSLLWRLDRLCFELNWRRNSPGAPLPDSFQSLTVDIPTLRQQCVALAFYLGYALRQQAKDEK